VGLQIDELRRKYELNNIFQPTQELIIHLENIRKSKQGFLKKKNDPEVQDLELALDMLKGSKQAEFILTIHYYDGDTKELSLFSADEFTIVPACFPSRLVPLHNRRTIPQNVYH